MQTGTFLISTIILSNISVNIFFWKCFGCWCRVQGCFLPKSVASPRFLFLLLLLLLLLLHNNNSICLQISLISNKQKDIKYMEPHNCFLMYYYFLNVISTLNVLSEIHLSFLTALSPLKLVNWAREVSETLYFCKKSKNILWI